MPAREDRREIAAQLGAATELLRQAGVASPEVDARLLAAHVLGVAQLVTAVVSEIPSSFTEDYRAVVQRRAAREPLQHIIGSTVFRHVRLRMRAGVFIPRPETEVVVQAAIDAVRTTTSPVVLDVCSGSGAIAVSMALELPTAQVHAIDIDAQAVALTRENAAAAGVAVSVQQGDVEAELPPLPSLDVLISNPPYIPPYAVPSEHEVLDYDPPRALYGGGPDGLRVPAAVVALARRQLRAGGILVMEHADTQGESVRELVHAGGGFEQVRTHRDLTGRDRYVTAYRN